MDLPPSAIERGRRVAQLRLLKESVPRDPDDSFIIEPVTPDEFVSSENFFFSNIPMQVALQSEIDTLQCIIRAKEREMSLLRSQLCESNKIIEKTRKLIILEEEKKVEEKKNISSPADKLLNSFSDASVSSLQRVLGSIQSSTKVTDIFSLEKRISELTDFETKYDQLYRATCMYLRLRPGDLSHSAVLHLLIGGGGGDSRNVKGEPILKDATKKPHSIAWTFK